MLAVRLGRLTADVLYIRPGPAQTANYGTQPAPPRPAGSERTAVNGPLSAREPATPLTLQATRPLFCIIYLRSTPLR